MKAPGDQKRYCRPHHSIAQGSHREPVTEPFPQIPQSTDHRTHPWKKAEGVPHVLVLPLKLWHGDLGIHGKRYEKRFDNSHVCFLSIPGCPAGSVLLLLVSRV